MRQHGLGKSSRGLPVSAHQSRKLDRNPRIVAFSAISVEPSSFIDHALQAGQRNSMTMITVNAANFETAVAKVVGP